jgi:hypothetical protein
MAKKAIDPIKAKEAKQKKIAIGGGVLLLLLGALQGPGMIKRLKGPTGPDWRTAAATTPAATTPVPGGVALPTLAGTPTDTTTQASTSGLVADSTPTASVGQLASFGRFESKDPFASQVPVSGTQTATVSTPSAPGAGDGSSGGSGGSGGTGGGAPPTPPTPPSPAPTTAVISVNGVQGSVDVGSDFPAATEASPNVTPLFHLISATATTAKIAIAGGSYADGAPSITLKVGKPVTLLNTADGTRYTLKLFPQGTKVAEPTTTGSSSDGATPVVPAATTTTSTTTPAVTTTTTTTKTP